MYASSVYVCRMYDSSVFGTNLYISLVYIRKILKFRAHMNSYKNPANRNRTSDLEISVFNYYSLPLCQLSYSRIYVVVEYIYDYITICIKLNYIRNQVGFYVQKMSGPLQSFRKRYYKVSNEVEHPIK